MRDELASLVWHAQLKYEADLKEYRNHRKGVVEPGKGKPPNGWCPGDGCEVCAGYEADVGYSHGRFNALKEINELAIIRGW